MNILKNKIFCLLIVFLLFCGFLIFWTTNIYIKIGPYDLLTYVSDKSFNQRLESILELDKERMQQKEITLVLWDNIYIRDKLENIPHLSIRRITSLEGIESFARSPKNIIKAIFNEQSFFVKDIEYEVYLNNELILNKWISNIDVEGYPRAFLEEAIIDSKKGIIGIVGEEKKINKKDLFSTEINLLEKYSKINISSVSLEPSYKLEDIVLIDNKFQELYDTYNEKIINPTGGITIIIKDDTIYIPFTSTFFEDYLDIKNSETFFSYNPLLSKYIYTKIIERNPDIQNDFTIKKSTGITLPNLLNQKYQVELAIDKSLTLEAISEKIEPIKNKETLESLLINIEPKENRLIETYSKTLFKEWSCEQYDLKRIVEGKEIFDFFTENNIPFKNNNINGYLVWEKNINNFFPTDKLEIIDDINLHCINNILYAFYQDDYFDKVYFWDTPGKIIYTYNWIRQEYNIKSQ